MKVRILQDGTYSKFNIPGYRHRVREQTLSAGDEVDFPDWYAESIIKSGLAVAYVEPPEAQPEQLVDATNAAFRLAGELNVTLETLTGSGAGGRITAGDVRKAAR